MTTPKHCCHDRNEPCTYGWSDIHLHRCQPTADDQTEAECLPNDREAS